MNKKRVKIGLRHKIIFVLLPKQKYPNHHFCRSLYFFSQPRLRAHRLELLLPLIHQLVGAPEDIAQCLVSNRKD